MKRGTSWTLILEPRFVENEFLFDLLFFHKTLVRNAQKEGMAACLFFNPKNCIHPNCFKPFLLKTKITQIDVVFVSIKLFVALPGNSAADLFGDGEFT